MEVEAFWAGAMRYGASLDLPALAARAGGWEALTREGASGLTALGVDPERAAAWARFRAFSTAGQVLTLACEDYPQALRRMRQPPPVLLVEGSVAALHARGVAVVGTRACTAYGRGIARHLGQALAAAGFSVVSGLARGVDGEAHAAALRAGLTVAVVGHGLGTTAPPTHRRLRTQMVEAGGAIVSTWPDEEEPRPWHFPARNAWIAGLAESVVVVEAPARSGALITARHAAAEGREVYAVPGPVGAEASAGCLQLLAEGAGVVWEVAGFVQSLGGAAVKVEDWLAVLYAGEPVDAVARRFGRSVVEVLTELGRREADGRVIRLAGGRYAPAGRSA